MTGSKSGRVERMTKFAGLWNNHNQCIVVPAATAHLPHVEVRWYAHGIWHSGHVAVLEGETHAQAAERGYGDRMDRKTIQIRPVQLRMDY
jgi:hypothetical protein